MGLVLKSEKEIKGYRRVGGKRHFKQRNSVPTDRKVTNSMRNEKAFCYCWIVKDKESQELVRRKEGTAQGEPYPRGEWKLLKCCKQDNCMDTVLF